MGRDDVVGLLLRGVSDDLMSVPLVVFIYIVEYTGPRNFDLKVLYSLQFSCTIFGNVKI